MALVFPQNNCIFLCTSICTLWGTGGEWADCSSLDYLQEALELPEEGTL
jgi:hypothetical protein